MFYSRVLQNIRKIKYTNNKLYKNHDYIYHNLIQNKSNCKTNIKSDMIPYNVSKLLLKYKKKDSNLIDLKNKNDKNKNYNINTIFYTITIGTTTILLLSYGMYSYVVVKHIDLLFCL